MTTAAEVRAARTMFPHTDEAVLYLHEEYRTHFTDLPELEALEFHLLQTTRAYLSARRQLVHVAQRIAEDAGYVADSVVTGQKLAYVPLPGDLATMANELNSMEYEVRDLCKVVSEVQQLQPLGSARLGHAIQQITDYMRQTAQEEVDATK